MEPPAAMSPSVRSRTPTSAASSPKREMSCRAGGRGQLAALVGATARGRADGSRGAGGSHLQGARGGLRLVLGWADERGGPQGSRVLAAIGGKHGQRQE